MKCLRCPAVPDDRGTPWLCQRCLAVTCYAYVSRTTPGDPEFVRRQAIRYARKIYREAWHTFQASERGELH